VLYSSPPPRGGGGVSSAACAAGVGKRLAEGGIRPSYIRDFEIAAANFQAATVFAAPFCAKFQAEQRRFAHIK